MHPSKKDFSAFKSLQGKLGYPTIVSSALTNSDS